MREKVSIVTNKYITALDYAAKTLLVLSAASSGVYLCSFVTVIELPVGIASTIIGLVFLVGNAILRTFLKLMTKKERYTEKLMKD